MSQSGAYGSGGGGGGGGALNTLSDGTTTVNPSAGGNIALVQGADSNIVVTANPGANSLNFQLAENVFIADELGVAGFIELPYSDYFAQIGLISFAGSPSIYNDANANFYVETVVSGGAGGGTSNIAFGSNNLGGGMLENLTGSINIALGEGCLGELLSGSYNLGVGYQGGSNYAGAESSNICIVNDGVLGESHVIRIGTQGTGNAEQNKCYIAGIQGVTPSSGPTQTVIIGTDGQLGSTSGGGGGGITTLDGNTGSATGSTVTVQTDLSKTTSYFNGSGSTLQMEFSDANGNLIFGSTGASRSGTNNAVLGTNALANATGNENCCLGFNAGANVTSGRYSIMIGAYSGYNYTSSESNNISLNAQGPGGESNTLRIGLGTGTADFQLASAYICGINGVNVGSVASVVAISGDKLGSATITAGTGITITPTANTITIASTGGSGATFTSVTTSPYTVLSTDYFLGVTTSSIPITIRLPNAPATATIYIIKDSTGNAATNNITLTTVGGSVTIDGQTSITMNVAYASLSVLFDGTSYEIF